MAELSADSILEIARDEFLRHGFDGTDFARIARRVGAAPNTLYRFFKGKTEIFVAVYADWAAEERRALARLLAKSRPATEILASCLARRRQHLAFRRSVRRLAHEDPQVRRAVAQARLATLETLAEWLGAPVDPAQLAVDLMKFEQLALALTEGELRDMGLSEHAAREHMLAILMHWRVRAAPALSRDDAIPA